MIQTSNPFDFSICDKYIIDFNDIVGTINQADTKRVKIITLANTKDIITMYPIAEQKSLNKSKTLSKR